MKPVTLNEWFRKLKRLAKSKGFGWLLGKRPEDHLDGFSTGLTPGQELEEQITAARDP